MTNISRLTSAIVGPLLLTYRICAATPMSDEASFDHRRSHASKKRRRRSLPLWGTSILRSLALSIMLTAATAGCTRYGVSGPEDLGLAARFNPLDPLSLPTTLPNEPDQELARNRIINQWLLRSDSLCADYQLVLSRSIRDTRLATDFTATVLAGLATIFAQPAVTRPLAGAATIALGVGGDIQSDLFLQQAGDVVGTAIQAVRTRARIELQKKFAAEYADYTLEQGLVDVQRYDRETCNLNVGLNEIRASLNIVGPVAPQANNPIIPLPAPTTATGAGPAAEGAASGTTAPMASIIIPPNVQKTPEGGFVFTPGKIVNAPATAGVATIGAPAPPAPGSGSTSKPATGPGSTSGGAFPSGGRALSARAPLPPPTLLHPDDVIPDAQNAAEKSLSRDFLKAIQGALCVEQTGDFGSKTRDAIQSRRFIKRSTLSGPLSQKEILDLLGLAACDRTLYWSPFEQVQYSSQPRVKALQAALATVLGKTLPDSGRLDKETRDAIGEFQKLQGMVQTGIMTPKLEVAIKTELDRLKKLSGK